MQTTDPPPPLLRFRNHALLVLGWAAVVATAVSLRPLLPVDETRYATVAWEMFRDGNWLVPHLNGAPYSHKPPLLFWAIGTGWQLFGVSEIWARLVPSLFALACLPLVGLVARRLWPDRPGIGFSAPAVLFSFLLWTLFSAALMFDLLVAFFDLAAILGLMEARRGRAWGFLLCGLALGLGVLAKGPVALLAPIIVALLAPWWDGDREGRGTAREGFTRPGRWTAGLFTAVAMAAAIGLAWALPAAQAGGESYRQSILFHQTGDRLVDSFAHQRPFWWYLPLLPAVLLPISLWPPLWRGLRRLKPDPGTRLCLAWFVPTLLAFSSISGKQPHYLAVILPAAALLFARCLDGAEDLGRPRDLALPLAVIALLGGAIAVAPALARSGRIDPWLSEIVPSGGWLLLLLAAGFLVGAPRLLARGPQAFAGLSIGICVALHLAFSGIGARSYDVAPLAGFVGAQQSTGRPIAFVGPYHGQLGFLGRLKHPLELIEKSEARAWLRDHPHGLLVDIERVGASGGLPTYAAVEFSQPFRKQRLVAWGAAPPYDMADRPLGGSAPSFSGPSQDLAGRTSTFP